MIDKALKNQGKKVNGPWRILHDAFCVEINDKLETFVFISREPNKQF